MKEIMEKADRVMASTYKRFPVVLTRGKGTTVWDADGREYTDFISGIAVTSLGHANERVAAVISRQAETLLHVSNLYYTQPQIELADWLVSRCFADKVFFCNSGAEANEAAIKLARRYFKEKGRGDRYRILVMKQSFHGRTMATLSATGQDKVRKGFEPILPGFDFVPFDDIDALREAVGSETCAVLLEPIQGEGGIRCPSPGYLSEIRQICNEQGVLLIFDEIQTGIGRTGKLFAHEHFNVEPDIMTLAKALGNGLPIGAMLAKDEIAGAFSAGTHASTFGGTPIITAAALEVLKILEEEDLIQRADEMGTYFRDCLTSLKDRHSCIKDVRGYGLLIGMELDGDGSEIALKALERGFLINCIQEKILRFAPPFIIETEEIDALVNCLDAIL